MHDILPPQSRGNGNFYYKRINLRPQPFVIPLIQLSKWLAGTATILFLLLGPRVQAPAIGETIPNNDSTADAEITTEELTFQETVNKRKELEQQLTELEEKIAEQQKIIADYQRKGKTLQNEIGRLNAEISRINLQIEAINLSLNKLNQDIYETQRQINKTQNKIEEHRKALTKTLQRLYEADRESLMIILLKNDKISDFFNDISNILLIQDNIRLSLRDIIKLRQELLEQKEELGLEKEDVENLKIIREKRKRELQSVQAQKENLLKITKNKESEYKNLLEETKKTAAEIRSQIFRLIGGGELTFEKAYEFARLAEGSTGVRAALILAILDRESLLGQNVGRCSYKEAMHPQRDVPIFLAILENLHIDHNSAIAKVSCPNIHGTYGGAMGPAQFIPSTWALYGGYEKKNDKWYYNSTKDQIGKITGGIPSNPWNNADAFVATALYMKDLLDSKSCQEYGNNHDHILPKQTLIERCAAAKYYAGQRWWTYRFWYGDTVVERANEFQRDIEILNS